MMQQKRFNYGRVIRVQDTDATGVLYFANLLQISLEAFEEFLRESKFSLTALIQDKEFLLPIVHTEADFFMPVTVGEQVTAKLAVTHIGTTSFTQTSEIFKENGEKMGKASIIHAVFSPKIQESIPIPTVLKSLLEQIQS